MCLSHVHNYLKHASFYYNFSSIFTRLTAHKRLPSMPQELDVQRHCVNTRDYRVKNYKQAQSNDFSSYNFCVLLQSYSLHAAQSFLRS